LVPFPRSRSTGEKSIPELSNHFPGVSSGLVVEDSEQYRMFVCSLLRKWTGLQVISDAADGLTAVERAGELNPDLIIMDIGLPRLDGMEAARRIREVLPAPTIIFLTQETSAEIVEQALKIGAGYVLKSRVNRDLPAAMASAAKGEHFVSPGLRPDPIAIQLPDVTY
jgi:DNA-binding NarL/FixJ family response regulator